MLINYLEYYFSISFPSTQKNCQENAFLQAFTVLLPLNTNKKHLSYVTKATIVENTLLIN